MTDRLTPWEQARNEYACDHKHCSVVFRDKSNGVRTYCRQCNTCGEMVESLRKGDLDQSLIDRCKPFNEQLRRTWIDNRQARYYSLYEEMRAADSEKWWQWYSKYLQTPQWKLIRAKVLLRCAGVCEGCGSKAAEEIHHLTYERVGHEMLFDLVGVCKDCHAALHPNR